MSTWDAEGFSGQYEMDTADICSKTGPRGGILMLMPNQLSWWAGADMCRRWGKQWVFFTWVTMITLK